MPMMYHVVEIRPGEFDSVFATKRPEEEPCGRQ